MSLKRDVFFINNLNFQLFMALLLKQMLGLDREVAVLHINPGANMEGRNAEAIWTSFSLPDSEEEEWGNAYFFTTVYPKAEEFAKIKCDKRILVYEGLTTYYTQYWAALYNNWVVEDFDEILIPLAELAENPDCASYVNLDCKGYLSNSINLQKLIEAANEIYDYESKLDSMEEGIRTIIYDRDFERFFPAIFQHTAHRLLTMFNAKAFHEQVMVKLHPIEKKDYFFDNLGWKTMKDAIPQELVFGNMFLQKNNTKQKKIFIIYNSSAALNKYALFGDENFEIICLCDLIKRYSYGVEDTLVAPTHTKKVLKKLEQCTNIRVHFPQNIEELYKLAQELQNEWEQI